LTRFDTRALRGLDLDGTKKTTTDDPVPLCTAMPLTQFFNAVFCDAFFRFLHDTPPELGISGFVLRGT